MRSLTFLRLALFAALLLPSGTSGAPAARCLGAEDQAWDTVATNEWNGRVMERRDRKSAMACFAVLDAAVNRVFGQRAGGPLCFARSRLLKDTFLETIAKLEGKEFEEVIGGTYFFHACRKIDCARKGFAFVDAEGARVVLGMAGCSPFGVKGDARTMYLYGDYAEYSFVPSTIRDRIAAWQKEIALAGARFELSFVGRLK